MLKPAFIDLSHWNTVPESLKPARANGIVGVVHKATEGTGSVDDKLDARYFLACDAGMLWGVYHFIRPGNIADQVTFFLDTTADVSDARTMFALDWEDSGVSLDDAVEFMQRLEDATQRAPVLYSGNVVKEALGGDPDDRINGYRLWLAQYASTPTLPPGWDSYWAWQYTDQGGVSGVQPPTDLNAFDGTVRELRRSWSGAPWTPPQPQPPQPDKLVVTVIAPPGVEVRAVAED
jgi:lysozyme